MSQNFMDNTPLENFSPELFRNFMDKSCLPGLLPSKSFPIHHSRLYGQAKAGAEPTKPAGTTVLVARVFCKARGVPPW
jgi:hypothetical protein